MNTIMIEFKIHELNRNIGSLERQGRTEEAEEMKASLKYWEQQLRDVEWQNLEDRVGLRSLERNA